MTSPSLTCIPVHFLRCNRKDGVVASLLRMCLEVCHACKWHLSSLSEWKWSWKALRQLMQHLGKWLNPVHTNDFIVWISWTGVHIQMTTEIQSNIFQRVLSNSSTLQNKMYHLSQSLPECIHNLKNLKTVLNLWPSLNIEQ